MNEKIMHRAYSQENLFNIISEFAQNSNEKRNELNSSLADLVLWIFRSNSLLHILFDFMFNFHFFFLFY